MRCAIFIAIASVALSAASFEETSQVDEVFPLSHKEPFGEEFVEDSAPIKVAHDGSFKKGNVLLESTLAAQGPYWKWTDKYKTKADGKYRLRQQLKHGKVVKKDWVQMAPKGVSVRVEAKHEKKDPEFVETGAGRRRLCARLYEHSNFRGRQYHVYSNVRYLRGFNDKLSSMRVYGCTIRLYQHSNYRGRSHAYGPGSYNFHTIRRTIGNDSVSSVRVWHRRQRRRHRHRRGGCSSSLRGCRKVCYRPTGRGKVCAYQCNNCHRHRRVSWKHSNLQCRTTARGSNRAGVVYATGSSHGYTMVGGGINNHYRAFNKLSAFEESFPHGNNWRCDTGFGPGRVTCYARSCRMRGLQCITRSVYKHGSGIAQASLPGGYIMTSGGIFNHYRHWNKHAAFETSQPIGSRTWRCDMGLGAGRFNCYVRGCRFARRNTRLQCITRQSGIGNHHNVQCPRMWTMTGCGQIELRRQWNRLSGFEEIRPHGNGCVCDSGFGSGRNRCYTRCCRHITRRL